MPETTNTKLVEEESPEELGALIMNRRKKPKMARAMAKMRMKISLRRRRLFALALICGRELRLNFDLDSNEGMSALAGNSSGTA